MKSHIGHLTLSGQGGQCAVCLFRKHVRFFSPYTWSPSFDFCAERAVSAPASHLQESGATKPRSRAPGASGSELRPAHLCASGGAG